MAKRKTENEIFKFDFVMEELRSAVNNNKLQLEEYDDILWLLRIILESKCFIETGNELKTFLGNACGFVMDTSSTGRDRIVGWYFKRISMIDDSQDRQEIIKRIAKYTFASLPNNFKGWKSILEKEK